MKQVELTGLKFDVDLLKAEYDLFVAPKLTLKQGQQRPIQMLKAVNTAAFWPQLDYTREVAEEIRGIFDWKVVIYRVVLPNACYNWHYDLEDFNIHIPIETNEGCHLIYHEQAYHLPATGEAYKIMNNIPHTACNAGSKPRIHLIFDIETQGKRLT